MDAPELRRLLEVAKEFRVKRLRLGDLEVEIEQFQEIPVEQFKEMMAARDDSMLPPHERAMTYGLPPGAEPPTFTAKVEKV
jgi:hypothetical protein